LFHCYKKISMNNDHSSRRKFLKKLGLSSGALAAGKYAEAFALSNSDTYIIRLDKQQRLSANDNLQIALIGAGGMGTNDTNTALQVPGIKLVAVCDLYTGRLDAARKNWGNDVFTTKHYKEILNRKDIDAVIVATPDHWHKQISVDALNAGKHVYCEKPVGIDVKQAQHALEIGKKVKPMQSVAVGFQCRNAPPLAAVAERIRSGALGKIVTVIGNYNAPASTEKKREGEGADEYRLRNWLWDRALSGDILVEQNIHIIDLCNWMLGAHPIKATATGGRNVLTHVGNCWDNYQVDFEYPEGVHLSFASTQFGAYGGFDAGLKFFGSDGMATAPYSGPVQILGKQAWEWKDETKAAANPSSGQFAANGSFSDNLEFADRDKERSFIESITSGHVQNEIAAGVETALSCMLGRMAGYTGRVVIWDELMAHGESYELGMNLNQFA